jgi:tetratricopeptide (TPR) repeat protein
MGQVAMTPSGMVIVPSAGTAKPPWYRALAKPLPRWARAAGVALIGAGLVIFFFVRQGQGSDWADSLRDTGLAAGALAGLVLLATIVRALAGLAARSNPMRRSQLVSASILLGVLLIFAGEGVGLQSPVHYFQAATLENQQQWEQALAEYHLAGQRPPDSDALARVYVEWGEQLSAEHNYMGAVSKFETVLTTYPKADTEVSRAQTDEVNAYFKWADEAAQRQNYVEATSHYDTLLNLPYCKQSCQAQASALDATAYYNLAEQYLSGHQYQEAVNAFQAIQTRFGSSPEAQKIHGDWAKALLGLGQQQRTSSLCSSAIPTYDELIQQFGDTPEGQQALSDYNAPEPVTGRFLGRLAYLGGVPVAFLAQGLHEGISDNQFLQTVLNSPFAFIDASGSFTFKPLPQGSYDLAWGSVDNQGDIVVQFAYNTSTGESFYVATVGPLCAYDFGNIQEDVPLS